jgi:hypothetical protein
VTAASSIRTVAPEVKPKKRVGAANWPRLGTKWSGVAGTVRAVAPGRRVRERQRCGKIKLDGKRERGRAWVSRAAQGRVLRQWPRQLPTDRPRFRSKI